ncbi:fasciclin domain-containing protein [Thalassovita sp.]|uniref:fasciclin domain-containing protein n=1 Tax=Thalassovita sp. TaxID=1979401 RepID=UPI0029DE8122|nr:fasciclin domain-containing protein [Thalassovita sp.]
MTRFTTFALAASTVIAASAVFAASGNPEVGGAPMYADRTIVENAVNSADHETLVAAVKQAGLVDTLNSEGPFTVFAPTDAAFAMISQDSLSQLMMDENKGQLTKILTCHVVAANAMSDAIAGMIADDGGMHPVPTVGGCTLQARMRGDDIILTDENGREAKVTIADVRQSNGVIHVIDRVLLPAQQ